MMDIINFEVCAAYEGNIIALQTREDIFIYNYEKAASIEGHLVMLQTIRSPSGLKNFRCFQSGYILYLATTGKNSQIFEYEFDYEFVYNAAASKILNGIVRIC